MGEKIRDIRTIELCNAPLMVELNEGYTKKQGRVIHIQNKYFRYLLTEKEFCRLASSILRADVEQKYIKAHSYLAEDRKVKNFYRTESLNCFLGISLLNESDIRYAILEANDKVIRIMVNPEDRKEFHSLVRKSGWTPLPHPFGKTHGYIFLYQMHEFEIYEFEGFYYEVYYELPCKSLTEHMWMPLDRSVQKKLWNGIEKKEGIRLVGIEQYWIWRVTQCIFQKVSVDLDDIEFFNSHKEVLSNESLRESLLLIVFNFTDKLLGFVRDEKYEDIIPTYYSFIDY